MKKWQKTWLTLLASSLAVGVIAQGEATIIKIENAKTAKKDQPLDVIIIDSNGRSSKTTAHYDPSAEGINIDTAWAGPNTSIFIPSLNVGYIWYNGFWVNQEGYYWNGSQRVAVPDVPQWRTHWNHYWQNHNSRENREGMRQGMESTPSQPGAHKEDRVEMMRSNRGNQGDHFDSKPAGEQPKPMRSVEGSQNNRYEGMSPAGQGGAMRSSGTPQGDGMSGSPRSAK